MPGGIYVIQDDGALVEMTERAYDSEAFLQALIEKYPSILAGAQFNSDTPRQWLLIRREMAVPAEDHGGGRWAVDHLFLDQDGIPTFVEVKRSTDTRIRREVVGQMLDYAANGVVYWPVERLRAEFEARCEREGADPEQELRERLGVADGADAFWQRVKVNLQAGRVRLVFVADIIPQELKRIIEFLNQQMDPADVLGVEIKQYVGQNLKTLVPRVVGLTAEAQRKKSGDSSSSQQWTESAFFEELAKVGGVQVEAARRILQWAKDRTDEVWWGKGRQYGSFVPTLHHKGRAQQLFVVWTSGTVEIYFYWYKYKPPFDSEAKRLDLLKRLNAIAGIALPRESISKRPAIPLGSLREKRAIDAFLTVFDWVTDEIRQS